MPSQAGNFAPGRLDPWYEAQDNLDYYNDPSPNTMDIGLASGPEDFIDTSFFDQSQPSVGLYGFNDAGGMASTTTTAPHTTSIPATGNPAANHRIPTHGTHAMDLNTQVSHTSHQEFRDIPLPSVEGERIRTARHRPYSRGISATSNGTANNSVPFHCDWKGCTYRGTFGRKGDLMRHISTKHVDPHAHKCPVHNCPRIFNRKDNLDEHMQRVHMQGRDNGHPDEL